MAHERETRPIEPERIAPAHCSWQRLLDADGTARLAAMNLLLHGIGRANGETSSRSRTRSWPIPAAAGPSSSPTRPSAGSRR